MRWFWPFSLCAYIYRNSFVGHVLICIYKYMYKKWVRDIIFRRPNGGTAFPSASLPLINNVDIYYIYTRVHFLQAYTYAYIYMYLCVLHGKLHPAAFATSRSTSSLWDSRTPNWWEYINIYSYIYYIVYIQTQRQRITVASTRTEFSLCFLANTYRHTIL